MIKLINIPCSNSILIIFRKIKETIMIIRNLSTERWLLLPCTVVVDSITIDLNRPQAAGWIAAQQPFQPSAATVDHLHFLDHGLKIINYYYLAGRLLGHPCLCPSSADANGSPMSRWLIPMFSQRLIGGGYHYHGCRPRAASGDVLLLFCFLLMLLARSRACDDRESCFIYLR